MIGQFAQRNADIAPAAKIKGLSVQIADTVQRSGNGVVKVGNMQYVADLRAFAAVSDVGKRTAIDVGPS